MTLTPPHDGPTLESLKAGHTPAAIAARLDRGREPSYLRDFVYGAIDGTITTFAVVSGVAGAGLSANVILILGVANLLADGFSMAASNFLGTRAEEQQREKTRRMEERHIAEVPDGEREEVRQVFARQGFEGEQLEHIVDVITADRERWVETMIKEEHGLPLAGPAPLRAALATLLAFILIGAVPLLPFLFGIVTGRAVSGAFVWSTALTLVAFFAVGAAKSRFVQQRWVTAGLETLAIGGLAAAIAYVCGVILGSIVE
ncbi:MAG: hypothetical protein DWQ34_04800 [Planctomycetota bacterium]|nr:MAG: hypothetical protein DWQ29_04100 [Planctomycetota bacterium]REJ96047.1 MAG: hypothetical protein DWQ34_04800 [Planctomycetota bacterium]REK27182.1 MAG: hypothetical protein DWQ41_07315 [Planctomycetota bacterium]REK36797.1 MAG: hypothetical protein DWQ45_09320 [Planctomycetota bacterium]